MASIDEQFVEFIVKSLVGKPEEVKIVRTIDEKGVLLELTVDPEDLGRVIGKRGATAQSIRTLLRALGTKNDARYNLKIVDNGIAGPSHGHDNRSDSRSDDRQADDTNSYESSSNDLPQVSANRYEDDDSDNEMESLAEKTRKELDDLDDLEI